MIRVVAYQASPASTLLERKRQIRSALEKADRDQIDFLVFPECFLTRYHEKRGEAFENSLVISEPPFQDWIAQLSEFKVTLIIGLNERKEDQLFNSAAIIEGGHLLGVQRKHYLIHDYFTPSVEFQTFQSKGITFGVIICLDSNYIEPARILALAGASVLFVPMCNIVSLDHPFAKRPPYYSQFVARAHENRCWLVSADWIWPQDGTRICPGNSVIYDPDGREVKRALPEKEQFLTTEIERDHLYCREKKGRRLFGSSLLAKKLLPVNDPKS